MNDPAPAVLSLDFLLWFHLKGLLLLSLAAFFSWLLGSGSAGQRHLCWTSGAVSILLLAAVTPLLGIWTIRSPNGMFGCSCLRQSGSLGNLPDPRYLALLYPLPGPRPRGPSPLGVIFLTRTLILNL